MSLFDEVAQQWDRDPVRRQRALQVADSMRKGIPLDGTWRALEFGCGTAQLSFCLRHELAEITLVDTSEGMLDVARDKIAAAGVTHMRPLLADLTAGELPGGRFELIYSMMALHHLPAPEGIIPVFWDLLNEGGYGGYLCIAELEKGEVSFHGEDFPGHDGFAREELAGMVVREGFDSPRIDDCFVIRRDSAGQIEEFNVLLLICRKPAR